MKFAILDADFFPCGINVVFAPGRYNAAYFEHACLAEQTGSVLCQPEDLFVENKEVNLKDVL
nr:circularly permuted type 2 ATP-grasp protein [uncultured Treponema sp.]